MIKSFAHKGLETFFLDGVKKGIQTKHARKLADVLDRLNASYAARDMNFPGSGLHQLKGKLETIGQLKFREIGELFFDSKTVTHLTSIT